MVNTIREPLIVLDSMTNVVSVSQSYFKIFKVHAEDIVNHQFFELGDHQWDIPELHKLLKRVKMDDEVFDNFLVEHDFPIIGRRKVLLNARRISSKIGHPQLILLAIEVVK